MKLGRPPQILCSRGHTLAETRQRYPNGDAYCVTCKRLRDVQYVSAYPDRIKAYRQTSSRRSRYGVEPQAFTKMLASQNGKCAICKTDDWGVRGPHIDHNHKVGRPRGILCHRCNTALGLLRDDPESLRAAIKYLKRWEK